MKIFALAALATALTTRQVATAEDMQDLEIDELAKPIDLSHINEQEAAEIRKSRRRSRSSSSRKPRQRSRRHPNKPKYNQNNWHIAVNIGGGCYNVTKCYEWGTWFTSIKYECDCNNCPNEDQNERTTEEECD